MMCIRFGRMYAVNQLFINILLVVILSTAQIRSETIEENICTSKSKCNECIEIPSCAWHFEPEESFGNYPRCYQPDRPSQYENYSDEYQFMPNNQLRIISKEPLNSNSDDGNGIPISPQKVELKLRAGSSYGFGFQYEQVGDFPMDLYFIMDLSTSMRDERQKLTSLGNQLLSTLRNLTSDLQIGLGSYVHEIVTPNASKLNSPCTNCTTLPYGFRNEMGLSKNYNRFSDILEDTTVSNEISPAGNESDLFNTITQAIVCKNQIGWRNNARRILVVATNDGVPSTITNYNDHLCHVGNDGIYDWTTSAPPENPNISKLNLNARQNVINIIFAVTGDQIDAYRQLSNEIEDSSIGSLSSDSSNIVEDLVKQKYEQISAMVELKDNASYGVDINYYSKCLNPLSDEKETKICSGLKTGQVVDFRLEMHIEECPKDRKKWKETIQVYPVGIPQSLIIDLEKICSCPEDLY